MATQQAEYEQLIKDTATQHATATANARAEREKLAAAKAALDQLQAERAELRERLAAFERGELALTADEYVGEADRLRWYDVKIKGQSGIVRQAEGASQAAGIEASQVVGAAWSKYNGLLQKEIETLTRERRAALEAVLR